MIYLSFGHHHMIGSPSLNQGNIPFEYARKSLSTLRSPPTANRPSSSASLGLGKSSMYRHFESKEDIWNALLDTMAAYYAAHFGSSEQLPPVPDSPEELVAMTMRMVDFTVHDKKIVMTRKILQTEQFRDGRACSLASKHFLTGLTDMFSRIFAGMMDKGLLRRDDPEMLAFAYTMPVSALIHQCDRQPEKIPEAIAMTEAFSRHFIRVYGRS